MWVCIIKIVYSGEGQCEQIQASPASKGIKGAASSQLHILVVGWNPLPVGECNKGEDGAPSQCVCMQDLYNPSQPRRRVV